MKTTFQECYEGYSETNEDKTAFYEPGWRFVDNSTRDEDLFGLCPKPWRYQNAEESDSGSEWGQFSFYRGGGFVADLGYKNHTGFKAVTTLQNNGWLDRQTRAVLAQFSVFNPSVNILGVATYFYEVEASGLKEALVQTDILSLDPTNTASYQFYLICILLYAVSVLLFLGRECFKLYNHRSRYFQSVWNWVEMSQVVFSVLAVVLYIKRQIIVSSTWARLKENSYANISFKKAIIWHEAENVVLGILMFIVTAKLLRVIRFNKHVAVFSKALTISAQSLSSFSIVLLILFVAFLHAGVLMFGTGSERYSSVLKAAYFQLELTLGRVKARPISELAEVNSTYAKIFVFAILFTLTIICMNFFIGVINDALLDAKVTANESELHELVDEVRCKGSKERNTFFDSVSSRLRQLKVSQASNTGEKKAVDRSITLDSKKSSKINFDQISEAIKALRRKTGQEPGEKQPKYSRGKSFFGGISKFLKTLGRMSHDEHCKGKKRKKVRFQEDVANSHLRKLEKRGYELFQRLDRVMAGFSKEDEEYHYLMETMRACDF